uniref:Uncharacterized protein n=1 Tax=Rhizophora mucronata TaxID=61149 RepID=A0A2P2QVK4_RHIMU
MNLPQGSSLCLFLLVLKSFQSRLKIMFIVYTK